MRYTIHGTVNGRERTLEANSSERASLAAWRLIDLNGGSAPEDLAILDHQPLNAAPGTVRDVTPIFWT